MLFIYFQGKIKFSHCIWSFWLNFYFYLVLPFYLLKWDCYFSAYENLPNSPCNFWKHNSVFLQILHHSSMPSNITPLYFFSSDIIYVGQKQPIKVQHFEIFEWSGQNSWSSSCQFLNIHFLLWIKGFHQISSLNTLKCSGENLSNSSCHFPIHKSVFLQILHQFSVSWEITPLYFF